VEMLCKMWLKLDNDHSGRCDFSEFRPFAETRMTDLAKGLLAAQPEGGVLDGVPEWAAMNSEEDVPRVVSRFLKTLEQVLLGVKSSFVLEDMMRVLWPAAQITSLAEMRRWGTELSASLDRRIVTTPPLLPEAQLEDLQCVFKYFDVDHDGELKASEILASGLLNPSEVDLLMEQYDVDGDGTLGVLEFCEMLCPHGYRAHDK
ncbi:FP1, partial [Symbiodinium sp. KB8]